MKTVISERVHVGTKAVALFLWKNEITPPRGGMNHRSGSPHRRQLSFRIETGIFQLLLKKTATGR
jgi:hypothetical protein